jgi:hypothetical protein
VAKQNGFIGALKGRKRWANAASIVSIVMVVGLPDGAAYHGRFKSRPSRREW